VEQVALLGTLPVMSTPFLIDEFVNRGVQINRFITYSHFLDRGVDALAS
jgi:hypothetical protein